MIIDESATLKVKEFYISELPIGVSVNEAINKLLVLIEGITPEAIGVGITIEWDWFTEQTDKLRGHERFLKSFEEVLQMINGKKLAEVEHSHTAVSSSYKNTLLKIDFIAEEIYDALTESNNSDYDEVSAAASVAKNMANEIRKLASNQNLQDYLPKALKYYEATR